MAAAAAPAAPDGSFEVFAFIFDSKTTWIADEFCREVASIRARVPTDTIKVFNLGVTKLDAVLRANPDITRAVLVGTHWAAQELPPHLLRGALVTTMPFITLSEDVADRREYRQRRLDIFRNFVQLRIVEKYTPEVVTCEQSFAKESAALAEKLQIEKKKEKKKMKSAAERLHEKKGKSSKDNDIRGMFTKKE